MTAAQSVSEQAFSQALRLGFTAARPRLDVVVYRQQAGRVRTDKGTWMELAPAGASDLCGAVGPEGWSLQIEVKGATTRETDDQRNWRARFGAIGAIALVIRYDAALSLEENVARGVLQLRVAIAERRARG